MGQENVEKTAGFVSEIPKPPSLKMIRALKKKEALIDACPLWWSTDYEHDPREHMPFETFFKRLFHVGISNTYVKRRAQWEGPYSRDVFVYPKPQVPMTIITLKINRQTYPFLVTARPYAGHDIPHPYMSLEDLAFHAQSGRAVKLKEHYYPHIRGLFAGKRGNNFFWYRLADSNFKGDIYKALDKNGLSFMNIYSPSEVPQTYIPVYYELKRRPDLVDSKRPKWLDECYSKDYKKESAEEFIDDYLKGKDNLLVLSPVKVNGIRNILPLVVTTRIPNQEDIRKPVILGIYAENDERGTASRRGVMRIKNRELAVLLSKLKTEDFGILVDALLCTPEKGRPKYERVSYVLDTT